MAKEDKTSSISVQKMAILATIISALVGGLSGYLVSRLQTKTLISIKKDEIARSLAEADIEQMARLGIPSDYSPLAHYVVHRRILEDFDVSKPTSLKEERDNVERKLRTCRDNRMAMYKLFVARSDSQLIRKTIQSMRDEIEEYGPYIDNIPNTPEGKKYKEILRKFTESEKRRLDILEALSLKKEINRVQGPFSDSLLKSSEKAIKKNKEIQPDK